jgi:putative RecB family exonuclease
LRGIIDRLELDEDGELVVTDYKTGAVPREGFEQDRLGGVHFYALLCQRLLGRRPVRVQLMYLSKPEVLIARPSEQSVVGMERRALALWAAVERACERDDFRPRAGRLCDWCSFRPYCPAWGGDPALATELRPAESGVALVAAG